MSKAKRDRSGPAFPQYSKDVWGKTVTSHTGMTLRDYFAAKAMQGYMSRKLIDGFDEQMIADRAYAVADAMLAERAQ